MEFATSYKSPNVVYDLDTTGGLMEEIQRIIAPPNYDIKKDKKGGISNYGYRKPKANNHEYCDSCFEGGDLICCDKCPVSFHLQCYDPPFSEETVPKGFWMCRKCKAQSELLKSTLLKSKLSTYSNLPNKSNNNINNQNDLNFDVNTFDKLGNIKLSKKGICDNKDSYNKIRPRTPPNNIINSKPNFTIMTNNIITANSVKNNLASHQINKNLHGKNNLPLPNLYNNNNAINQNLMNNNLDNSNNANKSSEHFPIYKEVFFPELCFPDHNSEYSKIFGDTYQNYKNKENSFYQELEKKMDYHKLPCNESICQEDVKIKCKTLLQPIDKLIQEAQMSNPTEFKLPKNLSTCPYIFPGYTKVKTIYNDVTPFATSNNTHTHLLTDHHPNCLPPSFSLNLNSSYSNPTIKSSEPNNGHKSISSIKEISKFSGINNSSLDHTRYTRNNHQNTQSNRVTTETDVFQVTLPPKLCFVCKRSCAKQMLLQCDYCPLLFHMDCLEPPLTYVPPNVQWMCPNHPEHLLEKKYWKDSNSLTDRIKIWDMISDSAFNRNSGAELSGSFAFKQKFLRKVNTKYPLFNRKLAVRLRPRAFIPKDIEDLYERIDKNIHSHPSPTPQNIKKTSVRSPITNSEYTTDYDIEEAAKSCSINTEFDSKIPNILLDDGRSTDRLTSDQEQFISSLLSLHHKYEPSTPSHPINSNSTHSANSLTLLIHKLLDDLKPKSSILPTSSKIIDPLHCFSPTLLVNESRYEHVRLTGKLANMSNRHENLTVVNCIDSHSDIRPTKPNTLNFADKKIFAKIPRLNLPQKTNHIIYDNLPPMNVNPRLPLGDLNPSDVEGGAFRLLNGDIGQITNGYREDRIDFTTFDVPENQITMKKIAYNNCNDDSKNVAKESVIEADKGNFVNHVENIYHGWNGDVLREEESDNQSQENNLNASTFKTCKFISTRHCCILYDQILNTHQLLNLSPYGTTLIKASVNFSNSTHTNFNDNHTKTLSFLEQGLGPSCYCLDLEKDYSSITAEFTTDSFATNQKILALSSNGFPTDLQSGDIIKCGCIHFLYT